MAGGVRQEHPAAADGPVDAGLRRPPHEARPPRQRVATSLLPSERRLPLLLRRHQRLFRLGYSSMDIILPDIFSPSSSNLTVLCDRHTRCASLARLQSAGLRHDGFQRRAAQVRLRVAAARAAHAPFPLLHGLGERSQAVSYIS